MTRFVFVVCSLVSLILGYGFPGLATAQSQPNVVLFFVDDFGARDLSCYGSSLYETPHMDQLAAQGMRFTRAYAAYPRCVPSRQGLLSGKYPSRLETMMNQAKNHQHHLPLDEVSFGEAFESAGYETCYIGKWHLGKDDFENPANHGGPSAQGFKTVIHSGSAGATGSFFYPFEIEKGHSVENPVSGVEGDYLTDRLTDEAVNYISSQGEKPFLMVMAHYAVHTPIEAPEDLKKKYQKKLRQAGIEVGGKKMDADMMIDRSGITKTVQNNPVYAAMVEKTDDSLGRIVEAIEAAGISKNTIVILTSDHGGLSTRGKTNKRGLATSNAPLRQGKGSIFEGGTRVPLIVKWPGVTVGGTTSETCVTGTDHYPTMLEMAGLPLMPEQHVDGQTYAGALRGSPSPRGPMFWYKYTARPDSTGDTRAVAYVDGNDKIIDWIDQDLVEVFDLSDDVGEQKNLAKKDPSKTESMLSKLRAMESDVGDLREQGRKATEKRMQRKKGRE